MFNISSFLEKFSKNISDQESQVKIICDSIFKVSRIVLEDKDIKIQNNILYLIISPGQKNRIFMNKQKILDDLKNQLKTKIIDIR